MTSTCPIRKYLLMPKIQCACNEIISTGDIPCSNEYLFISDQAYDAYSGKINSEELYQNMKSFILCPSCKRLLFFWQGFDKAPIVYTPE